MAQVQEHHDRIFNLQFEIWNEFELLKFLMMKQNENNYDLEKRTLSFSKELIQVLKRVPKNIITIPLIDQGLRAGTSIGANYREANGSVSKKDFHSKIAICKKESKESHYFLELLGNAVDDEEIKQELRDLWSETKEYILIFGKILSSSK